MFCLRIFLACISGLACGSAYLLGQRLFDNKVGILWATLLMVCPLFVCVSIVPYQEALFLFLVFMGMYFYLSDESSSIYPSPFFISLSCLTRYEGWILCGIITFDIVINKKYGYKKSCVYSFCFILGIIIWLCLKFLFQLEPVIGGPLDFTEAVNKRIQITSDLSALMSHSGLIIVAMVACIYNAIGVLFVPMGAGMAFVLKEKYDFKVHLIVYTIVLLLFSLVRGLGGVLTTRMMVFPVAFLLVPVAVVLSKLWILADRYKPKYRCGMIMILLIVIWYAPKAVTSVHKASSSASPEYNIAKSLEILDPASKVLIYPRPQKNIWGESTISAIIGNSIKLKIDYNVFSFDMLSKEYRENIDRFIEENNIDYIISYDHGKYRFTEAR